MNKKNKIIILIFFFFSTTALIRDLKANSFYYDLIFFNTNKSLYYYDESIEINALWMLNYDINQEISHMQIQICDNNDYLLFNSSKFYEIGLSTNNWTIEIQNLDFLFINSSCILFIKAYNYYNNLNVGDPELTLLKSIRVDIIKRNISCEIIGYKSNIKYGEELYLVAQFSSPDKDVYLLNQSVEFKIVSKKIVIYNNYYTTNFSGNISLDISSREHLNMGKNSLIFNISGSKFFKESFFIYEVSVEKYQVFAEITSFNSKIQPNEDIEFKLLYYYYNETIHPLINTPIYVAIYFNNLLKFEDNFITNNSGLLNVNIFYELIEFKKGENNFLLILFFNGSQFLQNFTLSFSLEINNNENKSNLLAIELTLGSVTTSGLLIFVVFVYKKRRAKNQLLKDISFKY